MASPRGRARSPSLPPLFTETARDKGHSSTVATPVAAQFDVGDPLGNDPAEAALPPGQSRKRKRLSEVDDSVSLLGRSFVLKPQSSSSNPPPHTLYPVMVLPREHVPLSMLDFHTPFADIYAARRFTAPTLRIVDLETRRSGSPHVLIAVSQNKKMFVLDACDKGVFAICQIGYWVKLPDLTDKASICNWKLADKLRLRQEEKEKEREKVKAAYIAKREANDIKRTSISRRPSEAALTSSLKDRPVSGGSITPPYSDSTKPFPMSAPSTRPSTAVALPEPVPSQPEPPVEADALPFADAPPTSESIFDGIRSQYSESLYKSQGPLTYFAKGPLSRARAAFSKGTQDDSKTSDLITFLRSLIMTPAQLDNKYRDRIPEIIRDMKGFYNESDENANGNQKKKRARKMKIGRDGLFPYEESKVRSWWRHNMPELKDGAVVTDSNIKSYAMLLRTRETQMQLILILEALALESAVQAELPQSVAADATEELAKGKPDGVNGQLEEAKDHPEDAKDQPEGEKKKKKKQNLEVLADLLADRLGIWQSTMSDEMRFIESVQRSRDANIPAKTVGTSVEPLKDFCTDVIIPFFAQRLPEVCDAISKKLGGPSIITQKHAPKAKEDDEPKSAKKEKQTPGAVTKRTAQPRSSKSSKPISLGQVLEQAVARESRQSMRRSMSHGPRQLIEAMKTTQPREVPGLKREASESQLVRRTEHGGLLKAPGLSVSRSQSLVGAPATDDAKAHKRAQVEAELKSAISAIRKPNRELAGKAISEESERRTLAQIKKNRKPQRIVPSSSPQVVKATPMRSRYRDVSSNGNGNGAGRSHSRYSQISPRKGGSSSFSRSHSMRRYHDDDNDDDYFDGDDADAIPPSSALRPTAAAARTAYDDDVVGETPAKKRVHMVSAEPVSRPGMASDHDDGDAFAAVGETPARGATSTMYTTAAATSATTTVETPRHSGHATIVLETPASHTPSTGVFGSSPPLERTASPRRRSSGIKGLLFPSAGAGRQRRSGPMVFKSPARQPRSSVGAMPMTTMTATTAAAAAHVTASPFASATARSLAVKLASPAPAVVSVEAPVSDSHSTHQPQQQQQQQHNVEQASSPLKRKATVDIFAQLGWDDDFDDL